MKTTLLILFFASLSFLSKADAWDNLTMEEAKAVVASLEANPYIFDYCDCCDDEGSNINSANLVKVISTEIVTCEWNPEFYSVKYEALNIATYSLNNGNSSFGDSQNSQTSLTFYMNYTFGLNLNTKKATNFFNIVPYDYYGDNISCKDEFRYPTPKELKKVRKVKGYKKWYKKNL